MANLINSWLNPDNFTQLRDKFNAIKTVLSGGAAGQYLTKSGNGDGEFVWSNFPQKNIIQGTVNGNMISLETSQKLTFSVLLDTLPDSYNDGDFNPSRAGYYLVTINGFVDYSTHNTNTEFAVSYNKNGGLNEGIARIGINHNSEKFGFSYTGVVYLNGSTDYISFYSQQILETGACSFVCEVLISEI